MPYSGPGDDSLPENVKKLGEKDKRQWVEIWNSAYEKCTADGGDSKTCESSAFAQANGVVMKGKRMDITELWESIKRLFEPHLAERIKDVSSWSGAASNYASTEAYCNACLINENTGSPADWVQAKCKLPVKDPGGTPVRQAIHAAAAVLAGSRGGVDASPEDKKSAANKIISYYNQMDETAPDGVYKAAGKSPPARSIEFLPLQTRALTVTRQADGKPRWLMIAASAVVNKANAIDSTMLFDNFIRHAQETGEYPVLDFMHERDTIRFSVADWLRRDGVLYLASGTFDDTELGRAAANGLEKDPGYWGGSISYRITAPPMILQAEGSIPVYTDGVNDYISVVPERMAADLFTAASVAKEVNRMDKAAYDELVKLVGEAAAKQFADKVDGTNRTVAEVGMVSRAETTTPPKATAVVATTATTTTTASSDVIEVATAKTTTTSQGPLKTETRDVMPAVVAEPAKSPEPTLTDVVAKVNELAAQVAELKAMYGMVQEASVRSAEDQKRSLTTLDDVAQRLKGVEALSTRWKQWLDDAPEHVRAAEGIVRARDQEPAPMTLAQIAEQNLKKMNRGPHLRHQS